MISKDDEIIKVDNDKLVCYLKDKINLYLEPRNFLKNTEIFNSEHITECDRRIIYRSFVNICEKQEKIKNYNNISFKNKWIDLLINLDEFEYVKSNFLAYDGNFNLHGNIDLVLRKNNKPILFSFINDKELQRKYEVDIILKLWMSEIQHGIIILENTNQYDIFHYKCFKPIVISACKKCKDLLNYKIKGVLPEKKYEERNSVECSNCEYNKICWEG